jgi:hypothetical protein
MAVWLRGFDADPTRGEPLIQTRRHVIGPPYNDGEEPILIGDKAVPGVTGVSANLDGADIRSMHAQLCAAAAAAPPVGQGVGGDRGPCLGGADQFGHIPHTTPHTTQHT